MPHVQLTVPFFQAPRLPHLLVCTADMSSCGPAPPPPDPCPPPCLARWSAPRYMEKHHRRPRRGVSPEEGQGVRRTKQRSRLSFVDRRRGVVLCGDWWDGGDVG